MRRYQRSEMFSPEVPICITRGTHHDPVAVHSHEFLELVLIVRGSALHTIHYPDCECTSYGIIIGDVFSIMPNEKHEYSKSRNILYYNIMIDKEFIEKEEPLLAKLKSWNCLMSGMSAHRSKIHLQLHERTEAENCLIRIISEMTQRRKNFELYVKTAFLQFLIIVTRQDANIIVNGGNAYDSNIVTAISIMEDCPQKHFKMSDIAQSSAMSISLFYTKFQEATGMPPTEYLIKLRLEKACNMLISGDEPLSEIAYSCGFCDSNYFIKAFKLRHGITPTKFRQQFQQ